MYKQTIIAQPLWLQKKVDFDDSNLKKKTLAIGDVGLYFKSSSLFRWLYGRNISKEMELTVQSATENYPDEMSEIASLEGERSRLIYTENVDVQDPRVISIRKKLEGLYEKIR